MSLLTSSSAAHLLPHSSSAAAAAVAPSTKMMLPPPPTNNNNRAHHHHLRRPPPPPPPQSSSATRIPPLTHRDLCALGLEPLFDPPPSKRSRKDRKVDNNKKKSSTAAAAAAQKNNPAAAAPRTPTNPPCSISSLPNEMLLRVLSYLSPSSLNSVSRVSRRLSSVAADESLWTRVDAHSRAITPTALNTILRRNPTALRLARATLIHFKEPPPPPGQAATATAALLLPLPPPPPPPVLNLSYVDLTQLDSSPSALASLLRLAPNVKKLSLENAHISDAVLAAIHPTHLHTLNIALARGPFTHHALANLLRLSNRLVSLNMSWINTTTPTEPGAEEGNSSPSSCCNWTSADLSVVLSSLPPTVTHLNVAGFRDALNDQHLCDLLLPLLSPHLESLDISDSPLVTSQFVTSLTSLSPPHLTHLSLSRCYAISPGSFRSLAALPALKSLDIFTLLKEPSLKYLAANHLPNVNVNANPVSAVARPTTGNKRSSIWGVQVAPSGNRTTGTAAAAAK